MPPQAKLLLADGTAFAGQAIGATGRAACGEIVFNTAISGYQEILTDPSYARQLITLTHPHIGNTGACAEDEESRQVFCAGLIVKNAPNTYQNWRAQMSLREYLRANKVIAISDIDTRKLTRHIRNKGAQAGCIVVGKGESDISANAIEQALQQAQNFAGLGGMDLAKEVGTRKAYDWQDGIWTMPGETEMQALTAMAALSAKMRAAESKSKSTSAAQSKSQSKSKSNAKPYKVIACDYGIKHNILRMLTAHGCNVRVMPPTVTADEIRAENPDGVFLSNGPGDPEPCDYAIEAIGELLSDANSTSANPSARQLPIFGICLGHQLLALACGARTEKMKFGHHGANHPVRELASGRILITSQNHGFCVDEKNLPQGLQITHRSLFDNTIQGLAMRDYPAFSFQGHPEASPGPHDVGGLFAQFVALMADSASANHSKNPTNHSTK